MAQRRVWFFGLGCVVLLGAVFLGALALWSMAKPSLPSEVVLGIRLDRPIEEVAPDDPLAELTGDKPLSLRQLRNALVRAADDPHVKGLRVRIDDWEAGFATAQEVRGLIRRFSAAGKWTAAYMDTAGEFAPGNLQYFVASACDEVSLNPLGDVNLVGLSVRAPFIRGTLDKLQIEAEFPGRGAYKSARFMYTQRDFTPEHREMLEWILDSLMTELVGGVAESRGLEAEQVRNLVDQAPFMDAEAVEAGLVDRLEDWTEFRDRLQEEAMGDADVLTPGQYLERSGKAGGRAKIAVVTGVGAIMRGESRRELNPLFGGVIMGAETISRAWREVREADGIRAAVFRVDSPGGSAIASEVIRREMMRTAEEIPVVVSMANVAASGGYWISCGAQRIVADPATITGSIGVLTGHLNMTDFWKDKLGITYGRIDRGANADLYGDLDTWTDEQRAIVDDFLDKIYDAFIERVAAGRGMSEDDVRALAAGRVFTGAQALENGLVDVLGDLDTAIAEARSLAGLDPEAPVRLVEFPKAVPWWQQLLQQQSQRDVALEELAARVQGAWTGDDVRPPGVAWMPPVVVE